MVHQSPTTRPAVPSRKVPSQKLPKALAQDELEALKSVRMNPRDRALIAVLSMCGLRVSEACSLTIDNIDWSTDTPSLRFTDKRGKERVVPMNLEVQDVLREWLESRHFSDSEYVFCNLRNGQRLSRKTVWAAMKTYAQRAGIRHVHPHMLRHTFGIEDYRMTETNILQQSAGNPRAIIEIVERLRKEPAVTRSVVRDVLHTGARNQIDLTFAVVLLLLAVVAARFFMRGIGSMEGYVLAGIGSALLVGIRFFMYRFKR